MITTLIATLSFVAPMATDDMTCPVMVGGKANTSGGSVVYAGARFFFCCAGCDGKFSKDPTAFLKTAETSKKVIGESMFDPVTGKKADKSANFASDWKGIRFHFNSSENKATFDKAPAKYGVLPKSEVLTCAVAGDKMKSPQEAYGYVDYKGTRYYICCAGCMPKMQKDPATYATKNAKLVKKAVASKYVTD